ncbi:MAG: PaaI family thioesterase [Alphaproteobacteria bacterium]
MADPTPPDPDYAARVRASFGRQAFMDHLGATLAEVGPGRCRIVVPYRRELSQQHGYFHGGVIGTVADNCGGYAAFTMAPDDASILTVEFKVNIVAPGEGDRLEGEGRVIRAGRRIVVCQSDVFAARADRRVLCATALVTLMLLPGRSDAAGEEAKDVAAR